MNFDIHITIFTTIILFLTFLAIIWYAWETRKLWKETVKQTELNLRPFVVITYSENERKFKLINLGNTPALNVKIDDVNLISGEGLNFDYVFPEIDLIPQKAKIDINDIKKKINDEISDTDTFDLGALIPYSAHRTFKVIIRYKNTQNDEYKTEGKVGEGTFDFQKIEKVS